MTTEPKHGAILIIDHDEIARGTLYARLVGDGYTCFEAESADRAVERFSANHIDLTILEVLLQDSSWLTLLTRIAREFPNAAVIVASDTIDPRRVIECMKGGAQDYLTKPFELEYVMHSVEEALQKRQIEFMLRAYQAGLEGKVAEQAKKIRDLFLNSVESLVTALEAKDAYTAGHSRRVDRLANAISQRLGLAGEDADNLRWGALLHDVGKIAIDPAIQNKPGRLTTEEYQQIMAHTMIGPRIVKTVANEDILNIIKYHHARYDGPEKAPIGARIVTLADSFDAMTSDRPYRKGRSLEGALREIRNCSGTQFDPSVVNAFLSIPLEDLMTAMDNQVNTGPDGAVCPTSTGVVPGR